MFKLNKSILLLVFLILNCLSVDLTNFFAEVDIYDVNRMDRGKNAAQWQYTQTNSVFYYVAMQPWRHFQILNKSKDGEWYEWNINQDFSGTEADYKGYSTDHSPFVGNDACTVRLAKPNIILGIKGSGKQTSSVTENINGMTCYRFDGLRDIRYIYFQGNNVDAPYGSNSKPCMIEFESGKQIYFRSYDLNTVPESPLLNTQLSNTYKNFYSITKTPMKCGTISASVPNYDTQRAAWNSYSYDRKSMINPNKVRLFVLLSSNSKSTLLIALEKIYKNHPNLEIMYFWKTSSVRTSEFVPYASAISGISSITTIEEMGLDIISLAKKKYNAESLEDRKNIRYGFLFLTKTSIDENTFFKDLKVPKTEPVTTEGYEGEGGVSYYRPLFFILSGVPESQSSVAEKSYKDFLESSDNYAFEFEETSSYSASQRISDTFVEDWGRLCSRCYGYCDAAKRCNCPMCCEDKCTYTYCNAAMDDGYCYQWPPSNPKLKIECESQCFKMQCNKFTGECESVGEETTEYLKKCGNIVQCMAYSCELDGQETKCVEADACVPTEYPIYDKDTDRFACYERACNKSTGACDNVKKNDCPPLGKDSCYSFSCSPKGECVSSLYKCPPTSKGEECQISSCKRDFNVSAVSGTSSINDISCLYEDTCQGVTTVCGLTVECTCDSLNGCQCAGDCSDVLGIDKNSDFIGVCVDDEGIQYCKKVYKQCKLFNSQNSECATFDCCDPDANQYLPKKDETDPNEELIENPLSCYTNGVLDKSKVIEIVDEYICEKKKPEGCAYIYDSKCVVDKVTQSSYCDIQYNEISVDTCTLCVDGKEEYQCPDDDGYGNPIECVKGECLVKEILECIGDKCNDYEKVSFDDPNQKPSGIENEDYYKLYDNTYCVKKQEDKCLSMNKILDSCYEWKCLKQDFIVYPDGKGVRPNSICVYTEKENYCNDIASKDRCVASSKCVKDPNCTKSECVFTQVVNQYTQDKCVEYACNPQSTKADPWEKVFDKLETYNEKNPLTNKCKLRTCNSNNGQIVETDRGCVVENDFPQYSEQSRACYECYCRPVDGELILIVKPNEYYDNGTVKTKYEIDKCGYCMINGVVNEKDENGNPKECIYKDAVDTTSVSTAAAIVGVVVVAVVIALVFIIVGAKQTWDLVMMSRNVGINTAQSNELYQGEEEGGNNAAFEGN